MLTGLHMQQDSQTLHEPGGYYKSDEEYLIQ